ncbi:alkaline shock response membrane anchor protein AmaP [Streptomyces sp. MUM 178J]|uniref:alkaline shock response membrane anchor protein AmaP n=1 Tax=Streptomyces sp. MUM 178J TaxID=2791991 RepID=UPI001F04DBAB|nr:alkaline shock response membrane anchor protein AmaP [Streptomyces sp. MUM 178J]WRQ78781.1 alkaline shock response membrane anchor protein AmaP [Streptomyces sp. MUM 178J]
MLKAANRIVLGVLGLALLGAGGAALAAGAGLAVPSWWPFDGPDDVLLSEAARERWRDQGWWWPVVISTLAVTVLLVLWWLVAQLRRRRLAELLVDTGDGEGALLRGRALEGVLVGEAEAMQGVGRAAVALSGDRNEPTARVTLRVEPEAVPVEVVGRLASEVLGQAAASTGRHSLPAEVRLHSAKHAPHRVA